MKDSELLERRLRELGSVTRAEVPGHVRIRTQAAAAARLEYSCSGARHELRSWLTGVICILIATLPITLGIAWLDVSAVSGVASRLFPPGVSSTISAAYAWIKVGTLGVLYTIVPPLLLWITVSIRMPRREPMEAVAA